MAYVHKSPTLPSITHVQGRTWRHVDNSRPPIGRQGCNQLFNAVDSSRRIPAGKLGLFTRARNASDALISFYD